LTASRLLCSIARMPVETPNRGPTRFLPMLVALPLALATAASYFGGWWWGLALIAHFRPHLAALSLVTLAAGLLWRARLGTALSLALLAVNAAPLLPYLGLAAGGSSAAPPANLRVLVYNMHREDTDRAAFRELIEREQPDLVVLSEISGGITELVEETALPAYRAGEPSSGLLYGVLLFSRWPVPDWHVEHSADGIGSVLSATLCQSERWPGCLRVIALHAAPPFGDGVPIQEQQLETAARLAAEAHQRRAVLAGDLDLTPWSPAFAELLARSGLVDTGPRRGLTATWLSWLPFVGLMIDHVLVSPDIRVAGNRLGAQLGSEHFPVIVDLAIPSAAP
jgi:endonuclease/exonuclease/phosphatase (EEP) superfamily protein YafD